MREALYTLERAQITKLIEQADRLTYSSDTVIEGKRLLALPEEEFFELEIQRAEQLGVGVGRRVNGRTFRDWWIGKSNCATCS